MLRTSSQTSARTVTQDIGARTVFPYDHVPRQRAAFHGEPASDLEATLWDVLSRTASVYPGREAIVSMWQLPDHMHCSPDSANNANVRWTYRHLSERALQLASSLRKLGCRPGMSLAALLWNSSEWGLFLWAAAKLDLTFAPIDPRVPKEAREMLDILKPDIIVAQGVDEAVIIDSVDEAESVSGVYIQCSREEVQGWSRLGDLLSAERPRPSSSLNENEEAAIVSGPNSSKVHAALIVFTSGTTGQAKGCPHTSRNLISQTYDYDPNPDSTLVDRWLVHTPVSHIFAINNALRAWRYGGAAIFPSKSFSVEATAKALVQEQCTIMSATPTLVRAILASQSCPAKADINLNVVSIAATKITAEDIRLCQDELGARDAIQAYGMSEGAPLISWSRSDALRTSSSSNGVGKVLPGASMRVCGRHSLEVVNVDEVGELHVSGTSVVAEYLEGEDARAFYDDDLGRWFKTGDQAIVDANGVVRILGRYKDLIIRGGDNLNPSKVEAALTAIEGVQAWVVGSSDNLAGEVPVAVVQMPDAVSKSQISQQAAKLGSKYALAAVYTLRELGFESAPTTSLGKVKKTILKGAVERVRRSSPNRTFLRHPVFEGKRPLVKAQALSSKPLRKTLDSGSLEQMTCSRHGSVMIPRLLGIWEELTGYRPSPTVSMTHIADSITLLRYCDAVLRSCGRRLYLQDVVEHDTIEQQARLLQMREPSATKHDFPQHGVFAAQSKADIEWSPPPNYAELGVAVETRVQGPEGRKCSQRQSARSSLLWREASSRLDELGLQQSLIQDLVPIRAALHRMTHGQRPQSYLLRTTFRVRNASGRQVRRGVEKALRTRSMLRSVLLRPSSGGAYHIVLNASHQLLEQLISEVQVANAHDAQEIWQTDLPDVNLSLMFHAKIISVQESGRQYLSMTYNHSAIDALSLWPWHKDLDLMIGDINAPTWTPTSFKLFADLFHQYRSSVPAQEAVMFHVERLRGISRLKKALWPIQKAPGWMISSDRDSKLAKARDEVRQRVWNGKWEISTPNFRLPRLARIVCLPKLRKLKEINIDPSLFAKCAVIVFNVLTTGASHALFNTWESGRSWPFVPQWIESMLPPAMSIDGPTVQWILNMAEVDSEETLINFMRRMSDESENMKQFEHAPWDKVVKGLRDEGDAAMDASFRQSFVWDVSLGLSVQKRGPDGQGIFKCLEPVERMDWADCGLFWNAFMIDRDNLYFVASWDTAQMNDVEVECHCDRMADVMRRLGEEGNWDRTVGDVFMAGRS